LGGVRTLGYGGVIWNSDLKRCYYGICGNKHMGNGGVCIWTDSNFAGSKINKQTKRKRNSRRELQGRLNHCSKTLSDGGVKQNRELKKMLYENF
jgi:hypothetical protein